MGYLDSGNSFHMAAHLDHKDKIVCLQLQTPQTSWQLHTSPSAERLFQNNKECLNIIYKDQYSTVACMKYRQIEAITFYLVMVIIIGFHAVFEIISVNLFTL